MISQAAKEALLLLKHRRNVLIAGAPSTGKTRLANEVIAGFLNAPLPAYDPDGAIVLPNQELDGLPAWLPSPERIDRKKFSTAFHSGTKHRDFLRGIVPVPGGETLTFRVSRGTLFQAAEHALTPDGASLVVIEEISRGPAVAAFGGAIVAFELDKRLGADGEVLDTTTFFDLLNDEGEIVEYALPAHLYLLATMNRADTSVEALDVAFLRRWSSFKLEPDAATLANFFGLGATDGVPLPDTATQPVHIHRAAVDAWLAVNERIRMGRGRDFEIGHGVLMQGGVPEVPDGDLNRAIDYVTEGWDSIVTHVCEVFFGDDRSIAEVLGIGAQNEAHPYTLKEVVFAGEPRTELLMPRVEPQQLYSLLRAVAGPTE